MGPAAHAGVSPLDALFTATSAVCVTGLIVCDTGQDFSRFGQTVILVLIQIGGLGIMTFAALAMQMTGRKLSLRSQVALHDDPGGEAVEPDGAVVFPYGFSKRICDRT